MKKFVVPLVALGFLVGLVGLAASHLGEPKYIFQFPDHLVPEADGDLSDWEIVPEAYWVLAENMPNQFGAPVDLSDFNSRYAWGWNESTQKLYFGGWIFDDMRHGTEHWSIEVDASHTGAQYSAFEGYTDEESKRWVNAVAQKYDFAFPEDPKGYIVRTANAATWVVEPPWTLWGARYISGEPNDFGEAGPDEVVQELRITPWADLYWIGPEESKIVDLEEDIILGIEVNTGDKDSDPGKYDDAYWRTFAGVNAWKFADQMGDWILAPVEPGLPLPTAVESITWGRIKSTFVK